MSNTRRELNNSPGLLLIGLKMVVFTAIKLMVHVHVTA